MKNAILAAVLLLGTAAFADGFICNDASGTLRIKVYHQTQPEYGTRNAAIMIVSNPSQQTKTIATFDADQALLTSESASYTADVDLRYKTSDKAGANIGGTKLGQLDQIVLKVGHNFAVPVVNGTDLDGQVTLVRRGAGEINIPMLCNRYLKGK